MRDTLKWWFTESLWVPTLLGRDWSLCVVTQCLLTPRPPPPPVPSTAALGRQIQPLGVAAAVRTDRIRFLPHFVGRQTPGLEKPWLPRRDKLWSRATSLSVIKMYIVCYQCPRIICIHCKSSHAKLRKSILHSKLYYDLGSGISTCKCNNNLSKEKREEQRWPSC